MSSKMPHYLVSTIWHTNLEPLALLVEKTLESTKKLKKEKEKKNSSFIIIFIITSIIITNIIIFIITIELFVVFIITNIVLHINEEKLGRYTTRILCAI